LFEELSKGRTLCLIREKNAPHDSRETKFTTLIINRRRQKDEICWNTKKRRGGNIPMWEYVIVIDMSEPILRNELSCDGILEDVNN